MRGLFAVLCCSLTSCVAGSGRETRPSTGTYSIQRTQAVPAQATSVVSGIVFDVATKQPLPGAIVAFANQTLLTDTHGRFRYEGSAGTYAVLSGAIGYDRVAIAKLKLAAGEQVELTFWIAQDQRPIYCK
jgi:hypothetical protein